MTLSPRSVEAAARANIAAQYGPNAEQDFGDHFPELLKGYIIHFEENAPGIEAALAVDGLCLVPKEPTPAMCNAAYAINGGKWTDSEYEPPPKDCWAAMLAAASDGDSPRQEKP